MSQDIRGQKTLESMNQAAWYNRWLLLKFKNYLKGDILEVGSGIGNFTKLLEPFGKVTALDIEKSYVKKTKEVDPLATVGLGNVETGEYFFKEKKFDAIVCLNILEHIKNDKVAMENLYKLLKKNGYLILILPSHQWLYGEIDRSIDHFRRYNKKELGKALQSIGFELVISRRLNMLGALGWGFVGKILKNKEVEKGKVGLFNILAPFYLFAENFFEPPIGISVFVVAKRPS